jgi:hypothetical protein
MCCVTSASFAVLINGEATDYFKSWRGLRQGCPLSLYLFILIMEGLSLSLSRGNDDHRISGIKVSKLLKIIHLMFVDDVLVMSKADPVEWRLILDILQAYCYVLGLCINSSKTIVHYWRLQDLELNQLQSILPFTFADLKFGFKYLGYYLKSGVEKDENWGWLVAKIEKKIGLWCNQWISIIGRLILVKSVMESQSIFWMSMEVIPKSFLTRIGQLMFAFLWSGLKVMHHFHLCRWDLLERPKHCGGWELRNLVTFNSTLLANTFWRALTVDSIWHIIIFDKNMGILRWSTGSVNQPNNSKGRQAFGVA